MCACTHTTHTHTHTHDKVNTHIFGYQGFKYAHTYTHPHPHPPTHIHHPHTPTHPCIHAHTHPHTHTHTHVSQCSGTEENIAETRKVFKEGLEENLYRIFTKYMCGVLSQKLTCMTVAECLCICGCHSFIRSFFINFSSWLSTEFLVSLISISAHRFRRGRSPSRWTQLSFLPLTGRFSPFLLWGAPWLCALLLQSVH